MSRTPLPSERVADRVEPLGAQMVGQAGDLAPHGLGGVPSRSGCMARRSVVMRLSGSSRLSMRASRSVVMIGSFPVCASVLVCAVRRALGACEPCAADGGMDCVVRPGRPPWRIRWRRRMRRTRRPSQFACIRVECAVAVRFRRCACRFRMRRAGRRGRWSRPWHGGCRLGCGVTGFHPVRPRWRWTVRCRRTAGRPAWPRRHRVP